MANIDPLVSLLGDIADSIRSKTEKSDSIPATAFPEEIRSISTRADILPDILVEPALTQQIVTASDSGYDGIEKIIVSPVTAEIDYNIQAYNIRKGISILGVEGSYDPSPEPVPTEGKYTITFISNDYPYSDGITIVCKQTDDVLNEIPVPAPFTGVHNGYYDLSTGSTSRDLVDLSPSTVFVSNKVFLAKNTAGCKLIYKLPDEMEEYCYLTIEGDDTPRQSIEYGLLSGARYPKLPQVHVTRPDKVRFDGWREVSYGPYAKLIDSHMSVTRNETWSPIVDHISDVNRSTVRFYFRDDCYCSNFCMNVMFWSPIVGVKTPENFDRFTIPEWVDFIFDVDNITSMNLHDLLGVDGDHFTLILYDKETGEEVASYGHAWDDNVDYSLLDHDAEYEVYMDIWWT